MTYDEIIEIIQAEKEGKKIQFFDIIDQCWKEYDLKAAFGCSRFRVEPERKYRPFKNAEEFLLAQKEHGLYIHCFDFGGYVFVQRVDEKGVYWSYQYDKGLAFIPFDKLVSDFYHWQDGTPCGVLEE